MSAVRGEVEWGSSGSPVAAAERHSGVCLYHPRLAFPSGFSLSNSSDEIIIETPEGTVIDQLFYDDDVFPDNKGYSMTLDPSAFDASANDDASNWCVATSSYGAGDFGTPGAVNDSCQ